ncbi:MAG: hypothetical protein PHX10_08460 [Gallionellaceae bacterium]|nr:hypothetical protein [Gallionellaceae bacterium]
MEERAALDAVIDTASVTLHDEHLVASLIVEDESHIRHVFYVTWKPGHEADWTWQGEDSWLQTEVNAEHLGIEPARLIALAEKAVADAARALQPARQSA